MAASFAVALKPIYNRSTKSYTAEVIWLEGGISVAALVDAGYMVAVGCFDVTIAKIVTGKMLQSWSAPKKACVLKWLFDQVDAKSFINLSDDGRFASVAL